MHKNNPPYRPDIDGLRAIAVTSVIGYHAFPQWVKGGFIGVDIFFVISGFLITSIILKSSASQGGFSVLDFYNRRIRRIFPALIVVLIACMIAGWLLLFPDEMKSLGKHTLGATFFVSNFIFWSEAGYFDTASELKPLLHLWSLSIEEQFYALWPLTLLLFLKSKRTILCTAILTTTSFLLCVFGKLDTVANFYMPLTRIWELLCGGLLATVPFNRISLTETSNLKISKIAVEILSLVGITLLTLSIFFVLNKKTPFPGWVSLLPILGTILIIAAGPTTLINRYILGNHIIVFIGLISYPLYLWHWPFLAFPKITEGLELSTAAKAIAICGTTFCAILTYYCVERTLRQKGAKVSICLVITSLLLAFIGFLFWKGIAQPKQSGELFQKIATAKNDHPENSEFTKSYDVLSNGITLTKIGDGSKTTLYIGDSNMRQYWLGVERTITEMNGIRTALLGGCKIPILHIHTENPLCEATNTYMFWLGVNNPNIDTVVISAQWRSLWDYSYQEGKVAYRTSYPEAIGTIKAMDQLVSNIRELKKHGKKVYLILNIPGGPEFEPHNLVARSLRGFHVVPRLDGGISLEKHKHITHTISPVTPLLKDVAQRSGAIILDPADFLCKNNWCSAVTEEGEPIYSDIDHLRGTFSYYHPQFIAQTLK